MHGWICPECGFVITNDAEEGVLRQEELEELQEQQQRAAEKAARQQRKVPRPPVQRKSTVSAGSILGKIVYGLFAAGLTGFVLLLALGIALTIPETMDSIENYEETDPPELDVAEMGDPIRAGDQLIWITEVFEPEWEGLSAPAGGKYIAVCYESGGSENVEYLESPVWGCLSDSTACTYVLPLYTSELTEDEKIYSMLYDKGVTYDFSEDEGILIYLVSEDSSDFMLYLVTGVPNGYGKTSVLAEACYTIPLTLTEEGEGAAT